MKRITFGNLRGKTDPQARLLLLLAGSIFLVACLLLGWFFVSMRGNRRTADAFTTSTVQLLHTTCDFRRALDGVCISSQEEANPKLAAVMIENHVDARPQAGLSKASIVYEAPVEANITRFLVIYPADKIVEKAGPVRSARPYYLDWVSEYGTPLYMHVGGSPDALDAIGAYGIFDMNEMSRGWYFWRSDDRFAPHNTYTSNKLWQKALDDYGVQYRSTEYQGWKFSSVTSSDAGFARADQIFISFTPPWYEAVWTYSSSTGKYFRSQMDRSHSDEDGTPIAADTVIVQETRMRVLDAVGRLDVETIGSGRARVFMRGKMIEGAWKKSRKTARTMWLDQSGNEIPLAPGKIWIEVVGQGNRIETRN